MYQKYTTALSMLDQIVANSTLDDRNMRTVDLQEIEVFCTFLIENFNGPEKTDYVRGESCDIPEFHCIKKMWRMKKNELKAELYTIPPSILENTFPVWAIRYMLWDLCFIVDPYSPSFNNLLDRYENIIANTSSLN